MDGNQGRPDRSPPREDGVSDDGRWTDGAGAVYDAEMGEETKGPRKGVRIDDGDLEDEVTVAIGRVVDTQFPSERPPDTLHHYTTLDGLRGILKEKKMWATNAEFMNDRQELRYAHELFNERIEVLTKAADNQLIHTFLGLCKAMMDPLHWMESAYVACFCERADLLSQWRGYSDAGGGGFALELETAPLEQHVGFTFCKVIYDRGLQVKQLDLLLSTAASFAATRAKGLSDEAETKLMIQVAMSFEGFLWRAFSSFKDGAFREEEEWRLVRILKDKTPEMPVLFRRGGSVLIPYVEMNIECWLEQHFERVPLRSVTLGPTEDNKLSGRSLRLFLASLGYEVSVKHSAVPLRRRP